MDRKIRIVCCSVFKLVGYIDHNCMTCTVDLDRLRRRGPGYKKLNTSLPNRQAYRDRIKELVKRC